MTTPKKPLNAPLNLTQPYPIEKQLQLQNGAQSKVLHLNFEDKKTTPPRQLKPCIYSTFGPS